MNIYITGSGGFVGQAVKNKLETSGHQIFPVPRLLLLQGGKPLQHILETADILINLAGENIMGRWTEKKKQKILNSRINCTRNLVAAIEANTKKPALFINASAVGIYAPSSFSNEDSEEPGKDFLAQVVKAWEKELLPLQGTRKIILRFGIIIARHGGILKKLQFSSRLRLPVILGNGWQPFPIIHADDITGFILYAIEHPAIEGIYNMVIPDTPTYREFAETVAGSGKRLPALFLPEKLLRFIMGEAASVMTGGANVIPTRLMMSGYQLKYVTLSEVINHSLNHR